MKTYFVINKAEMNGVPRDNETMRSVFSGVIYPVLLSSDDGAPPIQQTIGISKLNYDMYVDLEGCKSVRDPHCYLIDFKVQQVACILGKFYRVCLKYFNRVYV